jgi:hypothetical protein
MTLKISLPMWFDGSEAGKLKAAALAWFAQLGEWARWPLGQLDPETCSPGILDLIAWQRDIDRFDGEPLTLFRLRVKYAYANARDAGSAAGFKRIFQRLGIGYVELEERMPERDWDIVAIRLSDNQLAGNQDLLDVLIQKYGRTCRRYEWTGFSGVVVAIHSHEFNNDYQMIGVRLNTIPENQGYQVAGGDYYQTAEGDYYVPSQGD